MLYLNMHLKFEVNNLGIIMVNPLKSPHEIYVSSC